MQKILVSTLLTVSAVLATGCLQTRNAAKEQEEKVVLRKQVQNLQSMTADVNARFQDVEESSRRLEGRIEAVENKAERAASNSDKSAGAVDEILERCGHIAETSWAAKN